jgi:hypothetical protein
MMKKLRSHISQVLLVLLLIGSGNANAQEMLGVAFSIYSGISSVSLNPALLTGTRVYMDVNIITGDIAVANDMIYFQPDNRTIRKAISQDSTIFTRGRFNWGRTFNYYRNTDDKYAASNVKIIGPSMMIQADRHAFGLTTTFRSFNSGNQIPHTMPVLMYEGLSYEPFHGVEHNHDAYSFVSLTWSEIGLSYAYNFYDLYSNRFTFGITAKALFGYQGGYIDMRNSQFEVIDERSVDFKNIDADIAYSLPVGYDSIYTTDYAPLVKGYGAGFDFGIVFTKLKSTLVYERDDKLCARPYNDYIYKIGLSILDIGAITFNENAELHRFDNVSKRWIDFDTIQFKGIRYAMQNYSRGFYDGDPDASYVNDQIRVGLPAAVSLQFDYHLRKRVYLSALWMHPLKFNSRTAWRPAQLSVIGRYENRMFGVSVPVSLFDYEDPRVGVAVRFYTMTLGTDRLGSLLGLSNFNGMDFYFSFRFNIGKGACSSYNKNACSNSKFGNEW